MITYSASFYFLLFCFFEKTKHDLFLDLKCNMKVKVVLLFKNERFFRTLKKSYVRLVIQLEEGMQGVRGSSRFGFGNVDGVNQW